MMQTISQVSSTVSFITSSTDTGAVWSPLNGPEFVSSACFVWANEKASPNSGPPEDGGLGSLGVICFRCECKWTIQGTKAGEGGSAAAADHSNGERKSEMSSHVVDANVVCAKNSPEQWAALKNGTKKKTKHAVHGNSCILPNVCAAHWQTERGRPKLLPALSRSPLRTPPSRWWC